MRRPGRAARRLHRACCGSPAGWPRTADPSSGPRSRSGSARPAAPLARRRLARRRCRRSRAMSQRRRRSPAARFDQDVRVRRGGELGDVRRVAHFTDVATEQRAGQRRLARVGYRRDQAQRDIPKAGLVHRRRHRPGPDERGLQVRLGAVLTSPLSRSTITAAMPSAFTPRAPRLAPFDHAAGDGGEATCESRSHRRPWPASLPSAPAARERVQEARLVLGFGRRRRARTGRSRECCPRRSLGVASSSAPKATGGATRTSRSDSTAARR